MSNKCVLIKRTGAEEEVHQEKIKNLKIDFLGDNSCIKIHESAKIRGRLMVKMGHNCRVFIGDEVDIHNCDIRAIAGHSTVIVGKRTHILGAQLFVNEPNLFISIGESCLFGHEVLIRTSDGHSIYDMNNENGILNTPSKGISIGDHTWIGRRVTILKDVAIPHDCIVGACSFVTNKDFEANSIIAGVPAKTIKRGVNWDWRATHRFCNEIILHKKYRKV